MAAFQKRLAFHELWINVLSFSWSLFDNINVLSFSLSSCDDINVLSLSFSLSSFDHINVLSFCLFYFSVLSVKIVSNKSLHKFNNSFCLEVYLLFFIISALFILFNTFRHFLAGISLIVLFLILLTKSLMPIYLNSPILFL